MEIGERTEALYRENKQLRELLWITHPCVEKYGDDGELQCNQPDCMIDFKRMPAQEITQRLLDKGLQMLKELIEKSG